MLPILTSRELTFSYKDTHVLQGVSFDLFPFEVVALVGPNGVGKTTLLRICSGLINPSSGEVRTSLFGTFVPVGSISPKKRATRISMLESNNDPSVEFTVAHMVSMGKYSHDSWWDENGLAEREVEKILEQTGLLPYAERSYCTLSSGQQQRVWMAVCLAQAPSLFLLDEPMSSLDLRYQDETMTLLRGLSRQGMSIFLSVHDLALAAQADRVVLLSRQGGLLCGSPSEVLTPSQIAHALDWEEAMADKVLRSIFDSRGSDDPGNHRTL